MRSKTSYLPRLLAEPHCVLLPRDRNKWKVHRTTLPTPHAKILCALCVAKRANSSSASVEKCVVRGELEFYLLTIEGRGAAVEGCVETKHGRTAVDVFRLSVAVKPFIQNTVRHGS